MRYAAIGSDGRRPVVWGLGATHEEARADALRWAHDAGCDAELDRIVEISDEQAAAIEAGDVDAAALGVAS